MEQQWTDYPMAMENSLH